MDKSNEVEIDLTSENPIPVPEAPTGLEEHVAAANESGYETDLVS